MASPKPLASLSSGLLARPGAAKPAMRPQVFTQSQIEDLGWNDMGQGDAAPPADVAPAEMPPVLAERAKLANAVAARPKVGVKARNEAAAAPPASAITRERRAAFTLRLAADRHLRLRLASAVAGRSSQQLLVEALDAFLSAQPEVEVLARQVPDAAAQRRPVEK